MHSLSLTLIVPKKKEKVANEVNLFCDPLHTVHRIARHEVFTAAIWSRVEEFRHGQVSEIGTGVAVGHSARLRGTLAHVFDMDRSHVSGCQAGCTVCQWPGAHCALAPGRTARNKTFAFAVLCLCSLFLSRLNSRLRLSMKQTLINTV